MTIEKKKCDICGEEVYDAILGGILVKASLEVIKTSTRTRKRYKPHNCKVDDIVWKEEPKKEETKDVE